MRCLSCAQGDAAPGHECFHSRWVRRPHRGPAGEGTSTATMPSGPPEPLNASPVPKEGPNGDGEREPGITFSPSCQRRPGSLLMK